MKILSVTWDEEKDNTKIKFTNEFLTSHWVVKADVLQDIISELEDMYAELFTEEGRKS